MDTSKERIHSLPTLGNSTEQKTHLSTSLWQRLVVPIAWIIQFGLMILAVPHFDTSRDIARSVTLGPLAIHFYGLILGAAVLVAILLLAPLVKQRFHDASLVDRLLLWMLPLGFIGARLYFVAFSWDLYAANWQSIFLVWEGGLAIHGGIIGGLIGIAIALSLEKNKRKAIPFLELLDVVVPVLALAQAIGRWGNFLNQEAFGGPTMLPWKMFVDPAFRPISAVNEAYFHPTFLYESLGTLLLFSLLWVLIARPSSASVLTQTPGFLTGIYLIGYGLIRFFIEGLRMDSLLAGPVRVAQLVSILFVGIGVFLIVRSRPIKKTPDRRGENVYT